MIEKEKCPHFYNDTRIQYIYGRYTGMVIDSVEVPIGRCNGTKNCIEVYCNGNRNSHKCEYYRKEK